MKARNLLSAAAAALVAASAQASLENRQISVAEGRSESVDLGFAPTGYRQLAGESFVKVILPQGSSSALVTAVKPGDSQIQFPSPTSEGVLLTVHVVSDLDRLLRDLRRELSDFGTLEVSAGARKLVVRGTISNQRDWNLFSRIIKLDQFDGKVESLVEAGVDPATVGALRKDVEAAGFDLGPPGAKPGKGQLALDYEHNVVVLSGHLYSQVELDKALSVLKRQTWLEIVEKPSSDGGFSPIVPAVVNVDVDGSLLELGVAFVVVSKTEIESRTADADLTLSAVWGGIRNLVVGGSSSQHGKADNFTFRAGLGATLDFFAKNEFSREKQYGTIRFRSSGDTNKAFHVGGTLKVTPPALGEGEAPQPQDYEYGFKIVNKGSRRTGENTALADLEIEIKGEPYMPEAPTGTKNLPSGTVAIKQETRTFGPTFSVPLGQTVAVAGYESVLEQTMPPSGIPVMRNLPVLSWFTSSKKNSKEEYSLLFLVSIRQVDSENEKPMVENTPMADLTFDANRPNAERIEEEREAAKKYHGFWTWLNWFVW